MIALECALEEEDFFHFLSLLKMLTLKKYTLFTASLILRLPFGFIYITKP